MEHLLESEVRPESLTFMAKKDKQDSYFDVWNKGEMHQIYKIKTNNTKGYRINPPLFSIKVNERMRVFVTYLGLTDKPSKDRISVVFAHHTNVKDTVEQAWRNTQQIINTPQKRSYIKILFKEDPRRSIAEVNEKDAQRSVMGTKSVTARPQSVGSSRLDPSGSAGRDSDSYYTAPPKAAKTTVRKRISGTSNCSTEPSEETNEEANTRGPSSKNKKKGVSQTAEATEEGVDVPLPIPPVKPRSRRKVHAPSTEEEEAPPSPVTKTTVPLRRKQSPVRPAAAAVAAEPAEDEMAEAPIAPRKTRKPVQQTEEEEDEAPPKPPPVKPRSRRKTHTPRPPVEEDEGTQAAKKAISPVRNSRSPSPNNKPKSRRKTSRPFNPLESLVNDSQVVYIIQQDSSGNKNEEEEEESDRKTRKKSKDSKKKSSKKKRKEEEEENE